MRPLFPCWHEIANRLKSAGLIALFLDFDGTLARLGPRPEETSPDTAARHTLALLSRSSRFRIWIISGRRRADVRARMRVAGVRYLGLHGWEDRGQSALAEPTRRSLACLSAWMGGLLASVPGVWIETKEHALSIHFREAPEEEAARARRVLDGVVEPFANSFRIETGKQIWEVMPRELGDKGSAVARQLARISQMAGGARTPACSVETRLDTIPRRRHGWRRGTHECVRHTGSGVVPVFVGDDQADEAAFAALPDGITVRVGPSGPSHAQYRLAGVAQVRAFLSRLKTEFA
jgi:trehalose 6-phosphate phosphatase